MLNNNSKNNKKTSIKITFDQKISKNNIIIEDVSNNKVNIVKQKLETKAKEKNHNKEAIEREIIIILIIYFFD